MEHTVTIHLPDIGEGVVEGEVVAWLKQVGDAVAQDEPVVVVMTDKATVELPSPHPGVLSKQYYRPGEVAIKDKPLYDIRLEAALKSKTQEPIPVPEIPPQPPSQEAMHSQRAKKALATPPVRKAAKDLGINIHGISGTGKNGRVTLEDLKGSFSLDLETAVSRLKPPSSDTNEVKEEKPSPILHLNDDEEVPLIGIRGLMAKRMAQSKRTIPHFSYHEKVEVSRLVKLREKYKTAGEQEQIRVTYVPFFIRALSKTIDAFPMINSSYDEEAGRLVIHHQHHVGIAMASSSGLIVPVLKGVQSMDLNEIVRRFHELKTKALAGKLEPKEMKEATITVSNFGVLGPGGLWATPIINPPEAAILAVNKIQKQPVVKQDQIVAADILNISWSFDHRVIDGELAAQVSARFCKLIENPAQLL